MAGLAIMFGASCGTEADHAGPGTIRGTIQSTATVPPDRALAIAVYDTFPPSGPPIASRLVERYELPYRYDFGGLRAGTYYVGALVDVDRMDTRYAGMLNRKRDPYGYAFDGAPVVITDTRGAAGVDIQLEVAP